MTRDAIFVSTQWLEDNLGRRDVAVVDGSYYLSTMNRDAAAEYAAARIPGAIRFDIDAVKDTSSHLPHMLPGEDQFARQVGGMGLSEDMTIIVYDGLGLFSAPRVRWTLRAFGAADVRILDGGFPKWKAEGRPVEAGPAAPRAPATFRARFDASQVASMADVEAALASGSTQLVDARPAERFTGAAPEPRPNLPSGHMPGSLNLPFARIVEEGRLRGEADILAAMTAAGVDLDRPVITTCGSGVSAAILSTAMELVGKPPKALYDGSWAEWASQPGAKIETGEP